MTHYTIEVLSEAKESLHNYCVGCKCYTECVIQNLLPLFAVLKKTTVENNTKWKHIPGKNETLILQDRLKYDQEIYDFAAQRFNIQYQIIIEKKGREELEALATSVKEGLLHFI